MVHYSYKNPEANKNCGRSRANGVKAHYISTYYTASAIRGMKLCRAKKFLNNVLNKRECVPFRRCEGVSRTPQATYWKCSQGKWPAKASLAILRLLQNAEANAKVNKLKGELFVKHIEVLQAPKLRRRTFRAHGRINPYMYSPCHVQIVLAETRKLRKTVAPPKKKNVEKKDNKKVEKKEEKKVEKKKEEEDMPALEETKN